MRQLIAFAAAVVAGAPLVRGADYTSSVLYPLPTPAGFRNIAPSGYDGTTASSQVIGGGADAANVRHALLWSAMTGTPVDLAPAGFVYSLATSTDGVHQVGYGRANANANSVAVLWAGTAASAVMLSSVGFEDSSVAYGVAGAQQVGAGSGSATGGDEHAVLWTGSAASAVDLNPTGFLSSLAMATDGVRQVGSASTTGSPSANHAMLWTGSAASAVDLGLGTPYTATDAYGVGGGQQVGQGIGNPNTNYQALLWSGSAASVVDLDPSGYLSTSFTSTNATETNGVEQIGDGYTAGGGQHALLWKGTAASAVDLQLVLPADGTWTASMATSIDPAGNAHGLALGTYHGVTGQFAVQWSPTTAVPEPASLAVAAVAGGMMLARRRSARRV